MRILRWNMINKYCRILLGLMPDRMESIKSNEGSFRPWNPNVANNSLSVRQTDRKSIDTPKATIPLEPPHNFRGRFIMIFIIIRLNVSMDSFDAVYWAQPLRRKKHIRTVPVVVIAFHSNFHVNHGHKNRPRIRQASTNTLKHLSVPYARQHIIHEYAKCLFIRNEKLLLRFSLFFCCDVNNGKNWSEGHTIIVRFRLERKQIKMSIKTKSSDVVADTSKAKEKQMQLILIRFSNGIL